MDGDRDESGDGMLMRSPVDSRADERVEGGYVSPAVSRELAALMMGCTFFARQETNGWLQRAADEGRYVDTFADVPSDLLRLLRTGSYEPGHDDASSETDGGWGHSTTWEDLDSHPDEDDSADPFDDQTADEQNSGGDAADAATGDSASTDDSSEDQRPR